MALSYEFSIGSVRAKETSLLNAQDVEQLLSCRSEAELCAILTDKGMGSGASVDAILADYTESTWAYLKSTAPDFDIFTPFLLQNDSHNFKVALKGVMASREYRELMLSPSLTEHDKVVKAVENRRMSLMPECLQKPCDEAYELLAHTSDARAADSVLDRAVMEEMLKAAEKCSSEFLRRYLQTTVFYNNIKTAIRAARAETGKEYLEKALCECPQFRRNAVIDAAVKGSDYLEDALSKYSEYECNKAMEAFRESPSAFEKFVDNKLIRMARDCCKRASEGAEPLLGYYLGTEAEKKVVHIIASGIRTGKDAENIRERLREIYG
ncbi:MAG: V-type ATPase subunit [Ruminococcus sp.]|nr:V-type ATPase subunit [Ruminococcus sp.]